MAWQAAAAAAGGDILGKGIDFGAGVYGQNSAQDFAEKMAKRQIRWRVKDLEAAGLNPVLAAQGALGVGGAGSSPGIPGQSSTQIGGTASRMASARAAASQAQLNEQLGERTEAETSAAEAREALDRDRGEGQRLQNSVTARDFNFYAENPENYRNKMTRESSGGSFWRLDKPQRVLTPEQQEMLDEAIGPWLKGAMSGAGELFERGKQLPAEMRKRLNEYLGEPSPPKDKKKRRKRVDRSRKN